MHYGARMTNQVVTGVALGVLAIAAGCGSDDDSSNKPDARIASDARSGDAAADAADDAAPDQTNVLILASGSDAPLIGNLPVGSGTDFVLDATLGEMRVKIQNGTDKSWVCTAPSGSQFPNYDLISFRSAPSGSYYFRLSVRPEDWSVGSKPIDGTNISVYVGNDGPMDPPSADTVRGTAMSGMVELIKTPTQPCMTSGGCTPEQACAFRIENVDLVFSDGT